VQSDVTARRDAEHGLRRANEALEQDLRLAARVQRALLPPAELQLGRLRIARDFDSVLPDDVQAAFEGRR